MIVRPPRTNAHRERDALLQRFHDAGLVAVVSTNGSAPEADIQIVKGVQPGDVPEVWLTERGRARLAEFETPLPHLGTLALVCLVLGSWLLSLVR